METMVPTLQEVPRRRMTLSLTSMILPHDYRSRADKADGSISPVSRGDVTSPKLSSFQGIQLPLPFEDGGFGLEQSPSDMDTIDDLQRLTSLLAERGYKDEDIAAIMYGNWVRLLRQCWSDS